MLSEVRYDKADNVVRVTISEDLTQKDFRDALRKITASVDHPPNVNVIWDLQNVNFFNVDIQLLSKLKDVRDEYAAMRNASRAAILVPGFIEGSLMKMFSDIANTPSGHIKIVTTPADAEGWCVG